MTTPPPAEIVQEKSIQTSMSGNKNEPSPSTKGTKEALQAMAEERKKKLLLLRACAGVSKLYFAIRTCSPQ
ncbi:hypothetical protein Tco_0358057, partial [Tanacetum coccineum]